MAKKQLVKAKKAEIVSPNIIRANLNREVINSPNFVSLYTNDTQVQISIWDVRMIFGLIEEPPTPEHKTIIVKSIGEVRMSPQHAKRIAMILVQQLKKYEEQLGPIPLPGD